MLILTPSLEHQPESLLPRPILPSPSPKCGPLCAQLQGFHLGLEDSVPESCAVHNPNSWTWQFHPVLTLMKLSLLPTAGGGAPSFLLPFIHSISSGSVSSEGSVSTAAALICESSPEEKGPLPSHPPVASSWHMHTMGQLGQVRYTYKPLGGTPPDSIRRFCPEMWPHGVAAVTLSGGLNLSARGEGLLGLRMVLRL